MYTTRFDIKISTFSPQCAYGFRYDSQNKVQLTPLKRVNRSVCKCDYNAENHMWNTILINLRLQRIINISNSET